MEATFLTPTPSKFMLRSRARTCESACIRIVGKDCDSAVSSDLSPADIGTGLTFLAASSSLVALLLIGTLPFWDYFPNGPALIRTPLPARIQHA